MEKTLNSTLFVIDSGADISAVPASYAQKKSKPIAFLYAANKTSIAAYERRIMELNIGLRRPFL